MKPDPKSYSLESILGDTIRGVLWVTIVLQHHLITGIFYQLLFPNEKLFKKSRIFKISVVYIIYKFNIITCMKVTGETFSFILKREKEPKGQDARSIKTFRRKDRYRTELWRALYQKAPKGQFLSFRKSLTEFTKRMIS